MTRSNFCANCGARLRRKGWRALLAGARCDDCASRLGASTPKSLLMVVIIAVAAFAFGRFLRPAPPSLVIYRQANSPLSDTPVDFEVIAKGAANNRRHSSTSANPGTADETVYLCGARTKKGTPCRRRVHAAGDRCYQHKGLAAMVPLDKLTIKPGDAKK